MKNIIITIIFVYYLRFTFTSGEDAALPHGHLQPLGYQTPPTVDIDEFTVETLPRPEIFFQDYIKPSRAAIFRGAMLNTKAFKEWTDEYIKKNYGNLEVRLEEKKETVHKTPIGEKYLGRDTLGHFVDNYRSPDSSAYIVSELPKQMYKDVGVLPSLGACGELTKRFVEIDLWWSGGGSRSIIHKDSYNQINCLYRGTKYWKLFEYKYEKWLYEHTNDEVKERTGFSDVRVESVDLIKYPDFVKSPWSNISIHAGDCLFLPKDYYHQVDSEGPNNLAVSILFSRLDERTSINTSDCDAETDYKIPRPLSDFEVMWEWEGKGVMSMGNGDLYEVFQDELESKVEDLEEDGDVLTAEVLRDMISEKFDNETASISRMEKAISVMDMNGDKIVDLSEVRSMNIVQLREFGKSVEPYEPSNTYEYEYSFVCYTIVLRILRQMMNENDEFSRQQWMDIYMQECNGTNYFANEIFTKLAQSPTANMLVSANINDDDIERAVENWVLHWAPQYCKGNPRENVFNENEDSLLVEEEKTDIDSEYEPEGANDGTGDTDDSDDISTRASLKDEL